MVDSAFATDDFVRAQIAGWQRELGSVRRLAPKTLEAYSRDLDQFLQFLAGHVGGAVTLVTFKELRGADIRAFMAQRRSETLGSRSLARVLSALKSFFRYLEREGVVATEALNVIRTPKLVRSLPKALTVIEARRTISATAEMEEEPWIAARDMAVLSLCYGAGLRIAEALAVTYADLEGSTIRVTGKGGKVRLVPLIEAVRKSIALYVELSPFRPWPEEALFRGVKGGVLSPRLIQLRVAQLRGALGLPPSATPMRCAIPLPPICSGEVAICALFRNCWVMRACPPPKSIPPLIPTGCSKATARPIRAAERTEMAWPDL